MLPAVTTLVATELNSTIAVWKPLLGEKFSGYVLLTNLTRVVMLVSCRPTNTAWMIQLVPLLKVLVSAKEAGSISGPTVTLPNPPALVTACEGDWTIN